MTQLTFGMNDMSWRKKVTNTSSERHMLGGGTSLGISCIPAVSLVCCVGLGLRNSAPFSGVGSLSCLFISCFSLQLMGQVLQKASYLPGPDLSFQVQVSGYLIRSALAAFPNLSWSIEVLCTLLSFSLCTCHCLGKELFIFSSPHR